MVIVNLLGGLGNQMFQYALGRNLAYLNGTSLKIDTSTLLNWKKGVHNVNRNYDLHIFKFQAKDVNYLDLIKYNPISLDYIGKSIFHFKKRIWGDQSIKEKYFHFDPSILDLKKKEIYLYGLWQSYKYFENIDSIIRKDFEFVYKPDKNEVTSQIRSTNSVSIHVRRTDYLSNNSLGFIGIEYYKSAYKMIINKISEPTFFVFTDDIVYCKANFSFIKESITYVSQDLTNNPYDDFKLMSLCQNNIISNSTFAWWAAWLNNNPNKIVIAPQNWFIDPNMDSKDLIPREWEII